MILDRFNQQLLPLEQQICATNYALIEKLLGFYAKKSLSQYQKDEVLTWIHQTFDKLASSPFRPNLDLNALSQRITDAATTENPMDTEDYDMLREQLTDQFGVEINFSDEELAEIIKNPHLLLEKLAKLLSENDDQDPFDNEQPQQGQEYEYDESPFDDDAFAGDEAYASDRPENELLFSKGMLNRCYKKLAHVFHPDRAAPEIQAKSQQLMSQLSKAKKEQDAFTIFQLYQEYIGGDDLPFSEAELTSLNQLLSEKLWDIEHEKRRLKHGHDIESKIYSRFKKNSKRATNHSFDEHGAELTREIYGVEELLNEMTSLAKLKKQLNERWLFMRFGYDIDFFELEG